AKLLFQFGIFWRIGGTLKLYAIAIGVGDRYDPQSVSYKGPLSRLYSTRFELAVKSERVFAHEADRGSRPKGFLRLIPKLLEHDGSIAELKPAPANSPIATVML